MSHMLSMGVKIFLNLQSRICVAVFSHKPSEMAPGIGFSLQRDPFWSRPLFYFVLL